MAEEGVRSLLKTLSVSSSEGAFVANKVLDAEFAEKGQLPFEIGGPQYLQNFKSPIKIKFNLDQW